MKRNFPKNQVHSQGIDRYHKKPRTRREFMAQGYLGAAGLVLGPSLLSLVSQRAYGLTCSDPTAKRKTPLIIIDVTGGINIGGGNVIVGKEGGQKDYLTSYETIGLAPGSHPSLAGMKAAINGDEATGLLWHSSSQILAGIRGKCTPAVLKNVNGAVYCVQSIDDSQTNPFNPLYYLARFGWNGSIVPLVGSKNSDSGGNSAAPAKSINPAVRPVTISGPESTSDLVDYGLLVSELNPGKAEAILKATGQMSQNQIDTFESKTMPDKVKELVSCGYMGAAGLVQKYSPETLSVLSDPKYAAGTAYNGDFADFNAFSAPIAKLVLEGYAGSGVLQLPGYDYHQNTFAVQGTKEVELGRQIGQIIATASALNKSVAVLVITDGSVSSNANAQQNQFPGSAAPRLAYSADSGERGGAILLAFNPSGPPKMTNGLQQGFFNDTGAVSGSATAFSSNPAIAAEIFAANMLAAEGQMEDIRKFSTSGDAMEKYLVFGKDTFKTS
jgi:hypothetical protein